MLLTSYMSDFTMVSDFMKYCEQFRKYFVKILQTFHEIYTIKLFGTGNTPVDYLCCSSSYETKVSLRDTL